MIIGRVQKHSHHDLRELALKTDLKINASKIKWGFVQAQIYRLRISAEKCYKLEKSLFSKALGYAHFCFSSQSQRASCIREKNHNINTHFQRDPQTPYCRPNHNRLDIMTDYSDLSNNATNNCTSPLSPFSAIMQAKHCHVHQVAATKPSGK